MPFAADIDSRDEARGPIWGPFAVMRDNVESLVALNLGWSLQLLPGVLALVLPDLPLWARAALVLASATAVITTTGPLFALALAVTRGEPLSLDLAGQQLRALALPSLRTLAPLYGVFGVLIWLAVLAGPLVPAVGATATLGGLLWACCATYWGPLLVHHPRATARALAAESARLVWRYPVETLATALVTALALLIGTVSIGGLLLIVPVAMALLQTERYLDLERRAGLSAHHGPGRKR